MQIIETIFTHIIHVRVVLYSRHKRIAIHLLQFTYIFFEKLLIYLHLYMLKILLSAT